MGNNRAKSLINISFLGTNPQEARIANHLKFIKENVGIEIKPQIIRAVAAFFDTYAIGEDPNSSPQQIEEAFVNSLNALSNEMSNLDAYCRIRHGIDIAPKTWKRFGLLSPATIFYNNSTLDTASSNQTSSEQYLTEMEPNDDE